MIVHLRERRCDAYRSLVALQCGFVIFQGGEGCATAVNGLSALRLKLNQPIKCFDSVTMLSNLRLSAGQIVQCIRMVWFK